MKSKFAKKTLAAFVLAAALTSVASMPVLAEEEANIAVASTTGTWEIVDSLTKWDDDSINWTDGSISVSVTIRYGDDETTDYTRTLTAYIVDSLTKASTCTADGEVSFGVAVTDKSGVYLDSVYSNAYTNKNDKAHGHTWVLTSTEITEPTCLDNGSVVKTYTCSECKITKQETSTTAATGHSYGELHVDMSRLDNILLDANGNLVLDSEGNPQAADTSKNASYYLVETCENTDAQGNVCGAINPKTEKYVVIPVSTATEEYVYVDVSTGDGVAPWGTHNFEGYFSDTTDQPSNTHFVAPYSNGSWSQILDVLNGDADIDDYIRLDDCTKDGTYAVIGYNVVDADGDPLDFGNWNNVLSVTSYTIKAHHYELTASIVDKDDQGNESSSYLLKSNGVIVPKYDSDGNIVGAYNTHCTEDAQVVLAYTCANCGKIVKYEVVTIPAIGVHQYVEGSEKKASDVAYTDTGDGVHHTYTQVKQCAICGEWFAAADGTEVHHYELVKENEKGETCGISGSYDAVVRCKECGYEQSRITVTVQPTNKHVYGSYEFTWDNNLYVAGWADGNLVTTKVTVSQTCINCNGQGEKGYEGYLESAEAAVDQSVDYYDTYHNEYIGTLEVTMGIPSDATGIACSPQTVELTAKLIDYTEKDANGDYVVLATSTKTVTYYGSVADYEARTSHVAGVAKTVVENGNTYSVVYCTECGIELDRTLVSAASTTKLAAVTGLKASATVDSNAVTLTWNAVSGADYYLILAYRDGAYAGQIGYTATLKYVDSDASTAEYNFYWVLACYKNEAGTMIAGELGSYVYGIQPLAQVANLAATSANGTVTLTWDAVDRASYYKVMYGKSGSTLTTTTTTSTTFTDTTATAGEYSSYVVIAMYDTPSCGGVASVQSSSVTVLVQ